MTEKGKSQNSGILRFLTEGKLDIYLFIVINLSISSLWWLVNHITRWAGENANYVLVPLILGILISVFEVILIPKIKFYNIMTQMF